MMDILTTSPQSDPNNNNECKPEKYSLRPRSLRQKTDKTLELKKDFITTASTRVKKKDVDKNQSKQKPPPLSKYRRKTANARERNRMREINVAFETLRRAVPLISNNVKSGNEKLTKITTLRLAMKYIQALRQVLDSTTHETLNFNFLYQDTDLDILLSDGESLQFQSDMSESFTSPDHPLTSPTFSEPTFSESSPTSGDYQDSLSFSDPVIDSDFSLANFQQNDDFCEDFLNSHGVTLS